MTPLTLSELAVLGAGSPGARLVIALAIYLLISKTTKSVVAVNKSIAKTYTPTTAVSAVAT